MIKDALIVIQHVHDKGNAVLRSQCATYTLEFKKLCKYNKYKIIKHTT